MSKKRRWHRSRCQRKREQARKRLCGAGLGASPCGRPGAHKAHVSRRAAQGAAPSSSPMDRPACAERPRRARRCAAARRRMSMRAQRGLASSEQSASPHAQEQGRRPGDAPVRRALAGAGTRPCGPRATQPSGTPASSSARWCSQSTAASAGPPPTRRTGHSTCARPARSRGGGHL